MEGTVAQPLVLVLNNNLFFRFPIEDGLARQGCRSRFEPTAVRFVEALAEERPDLVIVDLEVHDDWAGCIREAVACGVSVIAFGPHDDLEARSRALEAGAGAFYSKAKFMTDLAHLVARHTVGVAP